MGCFQIYATLSLARLNFHVSFSSSFYDLIEVAHSTRIVQTFQIVCLCFDYSIYFKQGLEVYFSKVSHVIAQRLDFRNQVVFRVDLFQILDGQWSAMEVQVPYSQKYFSVYPSFHQALEDVARQQPMVHFVHLWVQYLFSHPERNFFLLLKLVLARLMFGNFHYQC